MIRRSITVNGSVTIVMSDPSGTLSPFTPIDENQINNDPFGVVGIHANLITKKIHVKLAKQFKKEKYETVANYLQSVKKKINPDFMGIETNNRGKDILKLFESRYSLPLHAVTTSSHLTENTRSKGFAMDKPFMINWFVEEKQKHNILFSPKPSKDMQTLIDQIPQIVSLKTLSGLTTHKAQRGRHDDLFMALLLCCHIALMYMNRYEMLK